MKQQQIGMKVFTKDIMTKCPCLNCPFDTDSCMIMRQHFRSSYIDDIMIIRQEELLPQCVDCGLFQKCEFKSTFKYTDNCKKYTEIRKNTYLNKCYANATNVYLNVNGEEIKKVYQFEYLGQIWG